MKTTREESGNFRALLKSFRAESNSIEQSLAQVDKFIRQHPYYQKVHNSISLYIPSSAQENNFTQKLCFIGREVIGTPLDQAKEFAISVVDGHNFQYLSKDIDLGPTFCIKELYAQYESIKIDGQDFDMGEYWRFEVDLTNGFKGKVHLLPNEENLFSQFVDY